MTSRKRSAASSRSKRPDSLPPVFLDRSVGNVVVAAALRARGAEVHTHDAHFSPTARDDEWLPEVGRRGWLVITKDTRIRYRATEQAALIAGRVRAFVLTRGDLTGPEMAGIRVRALPHIGRFAASHEPPFIAQVVTSGRVQMLYRPRGRVR